MADSTTKIAKLDGSNYQSWKFNLELLLVEKGLDGFIHEPFEPEPTLAGSADQAAYDKAKRIYDSNQRKAWATICLHVASDQQIHIADTSTAKDAWERLSAVFDPKSVAQLVRLRRRFYAACMPEGGDLVEHITEMSQLAKQLKEQGQLVSSEEFALTVLGSLPDSFDGFLTSMNARDPKGLTWESVRPALIEEYQRKKDNSKPETALFAGKKFFRKPKTNSEAKNGNFSKNNDTNPECWSCGKTGHIRYHCPKNQKSTPQNPQGKGQGRPPRSANAVLIGPEARDNVDKVSGESKMALFAVRTPEKGTWCIDSGCTHHMTCSDADMSGYKAYKKPQDVYLADNSVVQAVGEGTKEVEVSMDGKRVTLELQSCVYVPDMGKNLFSVKAATNHAAGIVFTKDRCILRSSDDAEMTIGHVRRNLYMLNTLAYANLAVVTMNKVPSLGLWHLRLGHLHMEGVKMLADKDMVVSMRVGGRKVDNCEGCVLGKHHRDPFPKKSSRRASRVLELVHSDVCGPAEQASIGGSRYFLTFVDDFSRFTHVYFLQSKSQVAEKLKEYVAMVENTTGSKIKYFRSDNGGEYTSKHVEDFLKSKGIVHELTVPYTPEQNGVAERMNRTLEESGRSMLCHAGLPKRFWAESVATAAYLRNRSPTVAVPGKTPYERWFGKKPPMGHIRVFGCDAYAHIPKAKRRKWDPKSKPGVFVGYGINVKGYRVFDPKIDDVVVIRSVVFFENTFSYGQGQVTSGGTAGKTRGFVAVPQIPFVGPGGGTEHGNGGDEAPGNSEIDPDENPDDLGEDGSSVHSGESSEGNGDGAGDGASGGEFEPEYADAQWDMQFVPQGGAEAVDPGVQVPKGQDVGKVYRDPKIDVGNIVQGARNRKQPDRYDAGVNMAAMAVSASLGEPRSIKTAWEGPNGPHWKKATDDEYNSLLEKRTWDLVPLPKGRKVVGCKWVFKVKQKADGTIDRYKARLVGQGFSQEHGIDYEEVFAPVARGNAIRTVLALANKLDWEIQQMDVKTAFLNGDLDTEIYMRQPPGYVDKSHPDYVCKVKRSLYGLKQSARCWNAKIDGYLRETGYTRNPYDPCVYVKTVADTKGGKPKPIILILYVDDIVLTSSDKGLIDKEKALLAKGFEMEDRGDAHFILGMSIKRDRAKRILTIDQNRYLKAVLERFGMSDCTPIDTPIEPGKKFDVTKPEDQKADTRLYQEIIGSLTYAMTATRPDICAAVGMLSQFMANPNQEHLGAARRVLRYLKGTLNHGLRFDGNGSEGLVGYSDADWAGDVVTRKSTSGYVYRFAGGTVSWSSKRQSVVAKSSTEAEYMALSLAASEAVWLRRLIGQFGRDQVDAPTTVYEDNLGAMALSKNAVYHSRTKHIDVQYHYVRECVDNGLISIVHVGTGEMVADVLTKGLARPKFRYFCSKMGVGPI